MALPVGLAVGGMADDRDTITEAYTDVRESIAEGFEGESGLIIDLQEGSVYALIDVSEELSVVVYESPMPGWLAGVCALGVTIMFCASRLSYAL